MGSHLLPNFTPFDLGIASTDKKVFLYVNLLGQSTEPLFVSESSDGLRFKSSKKSSSIKREDGKNESTLFARDFRISKVGMEHILFYKDNANSLYLARSKDLLKWEGLQKIEGISETAVLVPNYTLDGKYVCFYGERSIKVAYSSNLKQWKEEEEVLSPQNNYFDRYPLKIGNVFNTNEGILLFYYTKEHYREGLLYSVGIALFDKENPTKLIARSQKPILTQQLETSQGELYPLGVIEFKNNLLFYFGVRGKSVYMINYGNFTNIFSQLPGKTKPRLEKYSQNPIITPIMHHAWQSNGTFNPAAVNNEEGTHFIYRAMGEQNTSVLGYAKSSNGLDIDYRSDKPIYVPRKSFEIPGGSAKKWFMSGGGYGGCEDPRVTWIKEDDRYYLTYVAYNGVHAPRVAFSSISGEDFRKQQWNWSMPRLISRPNIVNKNAVLFPEKIKGKYVMMHRIFPNILLDFLDDLDFKNPRFLKGEYKITPTVDGWDSRKVGAGPPPIRTKDGWLLIYHAVDDRNDSQYKIGAMLLDLEQPWKVLYRSQSPILEPDQWYENEGFKSGVVYPCGAVIRDNVLFVYYGGADKFICVASRNLTDFLKELKANHKTTMKNEFIPKNVLYHA